MSKMKYLVTVSPNYIATLYTGEGFRSAKKITAIKLDESLPLTHGAHRIMIEQLMSDNRVFALTTEVSKWEKDVTIIYGQAHIRPEVRPDAKEVKKAHKDRMKKLMSEAGVNMMEVMVASALTAGMAALSLNSLQPLVDNINANAVILSQQAVSQQAQLDEILGN